MNYNPGAGEPFNSETGRKAAFKATQTNWDERRREAMQLLGWTVDPYPDGPESNRVVRLDDQASNSETADAD